MISLIYYKKVGLHPAFFMLCLSNSAPGRLHAIPENVLTTVGRDVRHIKILLIV